LIDVVAAGPALAVAAAAAITNDAPLQSEGAAGEERHGERGDDEAEPTLRRHLLPS